MISAPKEPATQSTAHPIKTSEVKKMEMVADGKFYKVTFQLGPKRSFGAAFPSQAWKENKSPLGEESTYDPVYAVFEQILDSKNVNGLIQENNDWQAANLRQKIEGEINRMLVVIDVKEAKDYVPPRVSFMRGGMSMEWFQMLVESAVDSRLKSK